MPKFIQVTRSDAQGKYVQRKSELPSAMDGELDDFDDLPAGTSITLTVVEMTEEEYSALPEFTGW